MSERTSFLLNIRDDDAHTLARARAAALRLGLTTIEGPPLEIGQTKPDHTGFYVVEPEGADSRTAFWQAWSAVAQEEIDRIDSETWLPIVTLPESVGRLAETPLYTHTDAETIARVRRARGLLDAVALYSAPYVLPGGTPENPWTDELFEQHGALVASPGFDHSGKTHDHHLLAKAYVAERTRRWADAMEPE